MLILFEKGYVLLLNACMNLLGGRGAPVIIGTNSSNNGRSMVTIPTPYVPEELVSQAQVVLQGKSRNMIIRELQVYHSKTFKLISFREVIAKFTVPISSVLISMLTWLSIIFCRVTMRRVKREMILLIHMFLKISCLC